MTGTKTYLLTVIGENLLLSAELRKALGGQLDRALSLGFATTRLVSADDVAAAKEQAIRTAYDAVRKALPLPLANDDANPPTIRVEHVRELSQSEEYNGPRAGFTFFADRSTPDVSDMPDDGDTAAKPSLWRRLARVFSR